MILLKTTINRLLTHPVKSLITIFSITLGVLIISVCMNMNFKMKGLVLESKKDMAYIVEPGKRVDENGEEVDSHVKPFNDSVLKNISSEIEGIKDSAAYSPWMNEKYKLNGESYVSRSSFAANYNFYKIAGLELIEGREPDSEVSNKEVLISSDSAGVMFPDSSPIGEKLHYEDKFFTQHEDGTEELQITTTEYTIVGVFKSPGLLSKNLKGLPELIYIINDLEGGFLALDIDKRDFNEIEYEILKYLNKELGDDLDFSISQGNLTGHEGNGNWMEEMLNMMVIFFSILAIISLIVSSFSVFSMTMISVVERSREVGLKRALGCKKPSIIKIFILEAVVITIIGSIPGILLSFIFTPVFINNVIPALGGSDFDLAANLSRTPEPLAILTSLAIMVFTGGILGIFPSLSSVNSAPIESIKDQ